MPNAQDTTVPLTAWMVTDDKAGNRMPALGLLERISETRPLQIVEKQIAVPGTARLMPPRLWLAAGARAGGFPFSTLADPALLAPPWPTLVVGNGRLAAPFVAAIKRLAPRTVAVQLQDPKLPPSAFDLVVPPAHDGLSGAGVMPVTGSLTRITPARLGAAADQFRPLLAPLGMPLVCVLIGGTSKAHRMTPAVTARLCDQLEALVRATGAGLAVTASRRTGAENAAMLRARLTPLGALVHDGAGENPYFGMLALADALVVTNDSVNMACEAAATGKPVHVVPLEGGSRKFDAFHRDLAARGITRPFDGTLPHWLYPALDETGRVADAVSALLSTRTA